MDTFDEFNQTTENTETVDEQDSNKQGEDLFGSDFTTNTTVASSGNPFSNVQQEHSDNSWVIDDVKQKEIFLIPNKYFEFFHLDFNGYSTTK